ncbi:MAG: site-2 protease family protein [Eggerthellaceae bacterium]|nr:site-2 protease family protein [Eggerthellaceae bacterium]
MDILQTILAATIVLGFLVFIHEGGHFVAARAFGVRVSEFMIGLPGPHVGIQRGETKFGVTAIPLGGYARVCGMEPGEMSPYLEAAMESVYRRGTAVMEDVASDCGCTDDEAYEALEELVEWGTIVGPKKTDQYNVYRVPSRKPTALQIKRAQRTASKAPQGMESCSDPADLKACATPQCRQLEEGVPAPLDDPHQAFLTEYRQQYRALPTWKRIVILLAGPGVNLLFAIFAFVLIYSVLGFDYQNPDTGEISHIVVSPLRALEAGFMYIGMVVQAVAGLFNPQTAAETVSNSTSVVGIAVMSKSAFEAGLTSVLSFTAMLSVSLGIMNLLPIPPLDGGRFVVEIYQRIRHKVVGVRAMNYLSFAGMALFMLFFIIMMNQDIQRFIFGNWS